MKTSRGAVLARPVRRHTALTPAALLLSPLLVLMSVGGCGASPGGDEAGPSVPPSARAGPTAAAASSDPRGTSRQAVRVPAVPQYRATLPPVPRERPVPARFAAASIGVDLPVIRTGVADTGLMQLPETNREVAWYGFGSRPGDPAGTTILAAHVDTRAEGLGPFARLRELRRGATLAVTDAAGRTRRYTVTDVEDVPKSRIPLDQLFRTDGPPDLVVLTCGGPFSRQTGYRDNIVVTAQPTR